MEVITPEMSGTFILVAVISCIITPILFKKWFPKENGYEQKQRVAFIGANQLTLPVSRELNPNAFESKIYHKKLEKADSQIVDSAFDIIELEGYQESALKEANVFDVDILFISTGDDHENVKLAIEGKNKGLKGLLLELKVLN
ncbi:hypothetical protein ACI2OX_14785 [Bacillus sp. N9]